MKTENYPIQNTGESAEQNQYAEFTPPPIGETEDGPGMEIEVPFGAEEATARNIGGKAFESYNTESPQEPFGTEIMQTITLPTEIEAGKTCQRTWRTSSPVFNPHTGKTTQGSDDNGSGTVSD